MENIKELEEFIINYNIATEEEIDLLTSINGYNLETLQDILYVRTGYRTLEQIKESEDI